MYIVLGIFYVIWTILWTLLSWAWYAVYYIFKGIFLFIKWIVLAPGKAKAKREKEKQYAIDIEQKAILANQEVIRLQKLKEEKEQNAIIAEKKRMQDAIDQSNRLNEGIIFKKLIPIPNEEFVRCSNNHRFLYKDFNIETQEVMTDNYSHYERSPLTDREYLVLEPNIYSVSNSRKGCHLCKSTYFEFENGEINQYRPSTCGCKYWIRKDQKKCPICLK